MTYNVHRCLGADGQVDPLRIAEMIAACEPDIVALQELDVRRARSGHVDQALALADALAMQCHFHPSFIVEEEQYGDAVLSALPMRLVKAAPLPGVARLEPRGALWVAIELGEVTLQVINTHLGLAAHERLAQIECLLGDEWLGHPDCRDPVVLLGDFNAVRRSRVYRMAADRLKDAQAAVGGRPRRTFPARMPLLRIDHVFCSPCIEVLDVHVPRSLLARVASDHLPLVVDFRVKPRK